MREILFRGKRLNNGKWIEGNLFKTKRYSTDTWHYYILPIGVTYEWGYWGAELKAWEIDPETVGEYTGLRDKNGKRIFEGDIISYNKSAEVVRFDTSIRIPCFTTGIGWGSSTKEHPYKISKRHVVIGNIHDNPELLKGGQDNG